MAYINGKKVLFASKVVLGSLPPTLFPPNVQITNKILRIINTRNGEHGSNVNFEMRKDTSEDWESRQYPIAGSMSVSFSKGNYYVKDICVIGGLFNAGRFEEELYFNDDGTNIAENLYKNDLTITSYDVASNIAVINPRAFQACKNLSDLKIRYGCVTIKDYAFDMCYALTRIFLPNTVKTIGIASFQYTGIQGITIPESVTTIGHSAFARCHSLRGAFIRSSADIGWNTFYQCDQLEEVRFEQKVSTIHSTAFAGCHNLKRIYVPWSEGEVAGAPWGANATVNYLYRG